MPTMMLWEEFYIYSIQCENELVSSSVSDMDRYVIIRKLLGSIFGVLPVLIRQWEINKYTICVGLFFRNVAYTAYVLLLFVQQMDFVYIYIINTEYHSYFNNQ
jgi:hypothetical protein